MAGLTADLTDLAHEVRDVGLRSGLDAVGIAGAGAFTDARRVLEARRDAGLAAGMQFTYRNPARSTEPSRILSGAAALVVGARRYVREQPPDASGAPDRGAPDRGAPDADGPTPVGAALGRVARYSWVDHYRPLRHALGAMADRLQAEGWRARVVADDNALVDRAAAHRAGLGWFGKNTNLLLPGAGSWFVLGSVVTDAPLPPGDTAAVPDGCGTCSRCVVACPTGALDTPGALDARRCLAWLVQAPGVFPVEHRVALGDRIYGCDECQEVCPVNKLAARRDPPPPAEPDARPSADALAMLQASDEELLAEWGRWYIPERDPRYLRRNALLVLANVGDPAAPSLRAAIGTSLRDPDPIVRGHAVWAARRLGYADLLCCLSGETDPGVVAEMDPARLVPTRTGSRPGA